MGPSWIDLYTELARIHHRAFARSTVPLRKKLSEAFLYFRNGRLLHDDVVPRLVRGYMYRRSRKTRNVSEEEKYGND